METTKENQNQVKEKVLHWLEKDEETRNSDNLLILTIWVSNPYYADYTLEELATPTLSSLLDDAESITRARRHIQNTLGLFPPTRPSVAVRRRIKQETMRQYYGEQSKTYKQYIESKYGVK